MRKRTSLFSIINAALLLVLVVATLYPFLYMASISLSSTVHVLKGEVSWYPKGFTLSVYKLVLQDPRILRSYMNTFVYVAVGTAVSLIVTATGAYALSKKELIFSRGFTLLIVVTMFFSGGMIPTFLVVKTFGLIDTIWGMALPGAVSTWNLIVMRTFYQGIPGELEESGRMDGLTDFGIFRRIVLPLSKAAFATIGLFYAVALWNNFLLPLLYLREPDLFPLQVIVRSIVSAGRMNSGEAFSVGGDNAVVEDSYKFAVILIATVPILLVYPFIQKYFVKGVMIGAIKG
ncbi:carbohydrate ABC transporter permease [Paenibacillus sp. MBLB4367]|uniref:carbohydrate ABC transporter permease n=1 Tax=Paenibacillus sp. MBLB4367 TaxID=3384767 RepID=UPI00390812C3